MSWFARGSMSAQRGARVQAATRNPSQPLYGFTVGVKNLYDVAGTPAARPWWYGIRENLSKHR
jgi:Asp-tRNA(Asn)/Glu-tRNA(Gln) amidotransferase A subunit family amidase